MTETVDMSEDLDRDVLLPVLKEALRTVEDTYAENPHDAENLARWGVVLLQLSRFQNGTDSNKLLQDGIDKLDEALALDPKKPTSLCWLGSAYRAKAFRAPNFDDAKVYFDKAARYYKQAYEMEPLNKRYKNYLEAALEAPELQVESNKRALAQLAAAAPDPLASYAITEFSESGPVDETMGASKDLDRKRRMLVFEKALGIVEDTYTKNPLDVENLTRWGAILLQVSRFQNGTDSNKLLQDGIDKFDEALTADPNKHTAMWLLGRAYTTKACQTPDLDDAKMYFDKAARCYERACELEPRTVQEFVKKLFKVVCVGLQAPELQVEIYKHGLAQLAPNPSSSSSSSGVEFSESSDITVDMSSKLERAKSEIILIYEQARRTAEAIYAKNPLDAENLTSWGRALIGLSQVRHGIGSDKLLRDGIDKLDEALVVDPKRHAAMWWLGTADIFEAFRTTNLDEAKVYFDKAAQHYEQACELEPQNERYKNSLKGCLEAPKFHSANLMSSSASAPDPLAPSSWSKPIDPKRRRI